MEAQSDADRRQETQQGAAKGLTSYKILSFAGLPGGGGHKTQVEHFSEVPPCVEFSETCPHG